MREVDVQEKKRKIKIVKVLPQVVKVKQFTSLKRLESLGPAYSAPLVLNLQHYHWYAATHSPTP